MRFPACRCSRTSENSIFFHMQSQVHDYTALAEVPCLDNRSKECASPSGANGVTRGDSCRSPADSAAPACVWSCLPLPNPLNEMHFQGAIDRTTGVSVLIFTGGCSDPPPSRWLISTMLPAARNPAIHLRAMFFTKYGKLAGVMMMPCQSLLGRSQSTGLMVLDSSHTLARHVYRWFAN